MQDEREMHTILVTSINFLFGEFYGGNHSFDLKVKKARPGESHTFNIQVPEKSVNSIQASLSMVTLPSYLSSTLYRFDVMNVSRLESTKEVK